MSGSSSEVRRPFAALAFGCAVGAMLATCLPWATGWRWSDLGIERTEGLISLVAAVNGALAAALAARGAIARIVFARWALASGAVMLAASVWFRVTVVGDADGAFDALVNCYSYPCATIHAGFGLPLAILASTCYLVAVAISLTPGTRLERAPASNWPIRA